MTSVTKPSAPILLPARNIAPGDLMDNALDKLRTVHIALCPEAKGWLDDATMLSVWGTLDTAIRELEPVRDRLQGAEAEGGES